jgi:hypothetical protein
MVSLIPFVLSGPLLAASPGDGDSPPGDSDQQDRQLADSRVSSVAAAAAADEDELSTAKQLMKVSAMMGRQAVQDGKADCKVVEASFGRLEEIEQQQPLCEEHQPDQPD